MPLARPDQPEVLVAGQIGHRLGDGMLAVWRQHDPFFLPAGAEAYRRANPNAEVRLLDTGHFSLETHANEIAAMIRDFLGRIVSE